MAKQQVIFFPYRKTVGNIKPPAVYIKAGDLLNVVLCVQQHQTDMDLTSLWQFFFGSSPDKLNTLNDNT